MYVALAHSVLFILLSTHNTGTRSGIVRQASINLSRRRLVSQDNVQTSLPPRYRHTRHKENREFKTRSIIKVRPEIFRIWSADQSPDGITVNMQRGRIGVKLGQVMELLVEADWLISLCCRETERNSSGLKGRTSGDEEWI